MALGDFGLSLEEISEAIIASDASKVALQIPEGLRHLSPEIVLNLEKMTGALLFLTGDPCFGACDLVDNKLTRLGIELIVHLGHSSMNISTDIPTIFIPVHHPLKDVDLDGVINHFTVLVKGLGPKEASDFRIGIVGTIQHLPLLEVALEQLADRGFDAVIPKGKGRLTEVGQVLGCNYSVDSDDISHYLFLGSGDFHPIGLALHTQKQVATFDPYTGEIRKVPEERINRWLRQRFGLIMAAMDAERFGIIIGEKPGQMRHGMAKRLKHIAHKKGKEAVLIAIDHIAPELLNYHPVECWVNTACPRIALDDSIRYTKPMLTPFEFEVLIGEKKWEDGYFFDEIP